VYRIKKGTAVLTDGPQHQFHELCSLLCTAILACACCIAMRQPRLRRVHTAMSSKSNTSLADTICTRLNCCYIVLYSRGLAPCVHHMKYDSSMLSHILVSLIHWHDAVLLKNRVTIWVAKAEFISVLQHTSWSALSCSPPGSPTALQRSC